MNCDRCKADAILKPLTLQGEEKGTTFNLCSHCMARARGTWADSMKVNLVVVEPLQGELSDESLMYFGQHKNKKMKDVPASYLLFIADQDWIERWPHVLKYINKNRQGLEDEVAEGEK